MRDISTIYNGELIGTFPNLLAKNATTETSFDGTPWLDLNIDDMLLGPMQALFDFLGQIPDGVAEIAGTSQVLDMWREMAAVKIRTVVNTTQTLTLNRYNEIFISDTSLGGNDLTVPDPLFIGHEVDIPCEGSGLTYAIGSGSLVAGKRSGIWDGAGGLGTPISDGLSLKLRAKSLTEWDVVNEVTADYVSVNTRIRQHSTGFMELDYNAISDIVTNIATGNLFRNSTGLIYPIAFATIVKKIILSNTEGPDVNGWAGNATAITNTGFTFNIFGAGNTTRTRPTYRIKGDY